MARLRSRLLCHWISPIHWMGGDNATITKDPMKDVQALDNQRSVKLANSEPALIGAELRTRVMPLLKDSIIPTQWGDGFGAAGCEMTHLAVEAVADRAKGEKKSLARIFVDVVQAYPSLVVALDLPLPLREQSTKDLLQEFWRL